MAEDTNNLRPLLRGEALTWDLRTIFPDETSWRKEVAAIREHAREISQLKGTITTSAESLLLFLTHLEALQIRLGKVSTYAHLSHALDMRCDSANMMVQVSRGLAADVESSLSFLAPELLATPWVDLDRLISSLPALERYRFFLAENERNRPHRLSAPEESLLGRLSALASTPESIRDALHDGDLRFRPVALADKEAEPTHGNIDEFMQSADRSVRRAAYESYSDSYLIHAQSFAATLTAEATTAVTFARARKFRSTFSKKLFAAALSPQVYRTAMRSCRRHYPLFQRYFRARARALGVARIAECDIHAPLSRTPTSIPYPEAVGHVLASLCPLGDEYVSVARKGLTQDRWADVEPRPGKFSNAFSGGNYGTRPFFLLNYAPTMPEVGTLTHELGHSMHSFFTHRAQSVLYSSYSMTAAETASNLNQVLLRAHLLKGADREMKLAVLDEAFFFLHRYLFLMPTLSRIEHALHTQYARGRALGCGDLQRATRTAFLRAYGDSVDADPERLGMTWAKFTHFYGPYYMFQYAVGISAALAIGARLVRGEPGLRERYIEFLSLGASQHPTDIFKVVGIDIESEGVYHEAFLVVEDYIRMLESL
jgi:oligoendopeptidase F